MVKPFAPYGFGNPYLLCFSSIIVTLANYLAENGPRVAVDFTFDNQEGVGEEARFFYQQIRRSQPRMIQKLLVNSPTFGNDKLVLPLQAADMLAWHIRRRSEREPDAFQVPDFLSSDGLHMAVDIGVDRLENIAAGFRGVPGTEQIRTKAPWKKIRKEMVRQVEAGSAPSMTVTRWKNTLRYAKRRGARLIGLTDK